MPNGSVGSKEEAIRVTSAPRAVIGTAARSATIRGAQRINGRTSRSCDRSAVDRSGLGTRGQEFIARASADRVLHGEHRLEPLCLRLERGAVRIAESPPVGAVHVERIQHLGLTRYELVV